MDQHKLEELKGTLPLYVRGDLAGQEKAELEEALTHFPELQQELQEVERIHQTYQELTQEIPAPNDCLYNEVLRNIRKEKAAQERTRTASWTETFFDSLRNSLASPGVAWAAACLFLVLGLGLFFRPTPAPVVVTLSAPSSNPSLVALNVVFKEGTSEKDMRSLLLATGTQIVDGPDVNGLYVVAIHRAEPKERVLAQLEKSPIVRFVAFRE
jgi:anti-sigma-K factor RskA